MPSRTSPDSSLAAAWLDRLRPELAGYARVALNNIDREFPAHISSMMTGPGDFPARPRDRNPVFYGQRWAASLRPLSQALAGNFLRWLPRATYPLRTGVHTNASFGISNALAYADQQPDGDLSRTLRGAADRWFRGDEDYPGGWEPSGQDFLSPALCEAELMARLLPPGDFPGWLTRFLPGIEGGKPAALFTPAVVTDSSDGYIAHLRGLNLSRAWCWRRLAESLPPDDPRAPTCAEAAHVHAEASLPYVTGDDYMVEHWLAAYAVLLFS